LVQEKKRRILFVDDEKQVLRGLKRMLHNKRREWEMAFATGGKEALDILSHGPVDVLVSDMRMPEMDGVQLLTEVRRRHPETIRIALSGHSDQGMAFKTVQLAHQYLSKPCDAEILRSTITRTCALRDILSEGSLKALVSRLEVLPSLPANYDEMMEALASPESSSRKIGGIISKDMSMTAKILKTVNSAFFGLYRKVSSPSQAVSLLGLEMVRDLAISIHIFSQFDQARFPHISLDELWKHSLVTGRFAKVIAIAEKQNGSVVANAFTGGVLHDLGKLVLGINFPERYEEAMDLALAEDRLLKDVEAEVFGTTHAEVGAYLLGLWGLPDPIIEAIIFHHQPGEFIGQQFSPLTTVHIGDFLAHEVADTGREVSIPRVDVDYLTELELFDRFPLWREMCRKSIKEGDNGV
jgi:HD-like signal output (HDOD) protein/CheY-like chemotaxis protein